MRVKKSGKRLMLIAFITAIVMLGGAAQLFSKSDKVNAYAAEPVAAAETLEPVFRTDDYGALVGDSYEHGGYFYQNLNNAYVKYRSLSGGYEYIYKANFNFSEDGGEPEFAPVAENIYLEGLDTINFVMDKNSNDYVGDEIAGLGAEDKNAIRQAFKAAVKRTVESGFSVGIKISDIKRWEGIVIIEYKFGDGDMFHDGSPSSSRSKMSFIVLDTELCEAHCVGNYAFIYGSSAVKTLGYPLSDYFDEITLMQGNDELTLKKVQFFKAGYIHEVNGTVRTVKEQQYIPGDETAPGALIPVPGPTVPESFRSETQRYQIGNDFYINYEKGCVFAKGNAAGTGFYYTSYFGRYFDQFDNSTMKKIALNKLFGLNDIKYGSEFSGTRPEAYETNAEFFQLFCDAYEYWYDKDIILGMADDGIKGWKGNTYILQFMYGDSTADPFGDGRTNIAALSYNTSKHAVYLIIDGCMNVFNTSEFIGMPMENPVYNTSIGVWSQRFSATSGVGLNVGNDYIVWNGNVGTYIRHQTQSYEKYVANNTKITATHGKDQSQGYVVKGGTVASDNLNLPKSVLDALSTNKGRKAATVFSLFAPAFVFVFRRKTAIFGKLFGGLGR